jgi:hypothetical protein
VVAATLQVLDVRRLLVGEPRALVGPLEGLAAVVVEELDVVAVTTASANSAPSSWAASRSSWMVGVASIR